MNRMHIEDEVRMIDEAWNALAEKLEQFRNQTITTSSLGDHHSRQCTLICERLKNHPEKMECLKKCTRDVVPILQSKEIRQDFPYDVALLKREPALLRAYERHQLYGSEEMIPDTKEERDLIVELYAMPVAAIALPEESWQRSMQLLQPKAWREHRQKLMATWTQRKPDYPAHAWAELVRKVRRHGGAKIAVTESNKEVDDDSQ